MAFSKKQAKSGVEDELAFIGVLEPALHNFYLRVDNMPDAKRKSIGFSVIGAVIVVSAVFGLMPSIPEFVHVIVGVPLGIASFFVGLAFLHLVDSKKKQEDPTHLTFKERNSPSQRMRYGITGFVAFIILSLIIKDVVPQVFGGILALNAVMAMYNYIRRTPEEIEREANGEIDPRDIVEDDEVEEEKPEVTDKETEEYISLVNSLPEEQRKILLNPKLNGALTVIDDDDIKGKKKRKLFGK